MINIDKGFVHKIEDVEYVEGIFDICRLASQNSWKLIVATNQSGIARGLFSPEDFEKVMAHIRSEFARRGCPLTDVYHCPYYEGGLAPWNIKSEDRKPGPGMILKAAARHGLDLKSCALLGDRDSDIEAGKNAGIIHNFRIDRPGDVIKLREILEGGGGSSGPAAYAKEAL